MTASGEAAAALDIQVHPLVVLSISDHYTRAACSAPPAAAGAASAQPSRRCLGLLFGQQDGRSVRILETVEMAFTEKVKGQPIIQLEALEVDMKLFSEAYANYECLGWYSSGSDVTPYDYVLQSQVKKYNERPLLVMLDPRASGAANNRRDLPLTVFEEVIHVVGDKTTTELVKTPYVLQADEAERITVSYCARVVNQDETGSAVVAHYTTMIKSVQSLHDRIAILHRFLCDVRSGKVNLTAHPDQQLLREIKALCLRLPVMQGESFRSDLLSEYNDALLVTFLASMTKGTQILADTAEHFQTSQQQPQQMGWDEGGGRGMDDDMDISRVMRGPRGSRRGDDGGAAGGVRGFFSNLMNF